MRPKVQEGNIVHYVLRAGRSAGQHRAALVVNAHGGGTPCLNLHVHLDGSNDTMNEFGLPSVLGTESSMALVAQAWSIPYDETGKEPGSWHLPESLA